MFKSVIVSLVLVSAFLTTSSEMCAQSAPKQKMDRKRSSSSDRRGRMTRDSGLKVGQTAPTFKLKSLDGKSESDLDELRKNKPVVLMFGSYT